MLLNIYLYRNVKYTKEEDVDEAIQMNADVNNRDLCSEELEEVWENEVEILEVEDDSN